ncbi:MAG: hypothetical protein ACQBVK_04835, partial [Candidatus Phytoplasma sp. TWB_XP]
QNLSVKRTRLLLKIKSNIISAEALTKINIHIIKRKKKQNKESPSCAAPLYLFLTNSSAQLVNKQIKC